MIYVVEDEENIRMLESYALRNSGFDVREFADGNDLCKICEEKPPELVILDLMLPGLSGMSILHQLRAHAATADVPVIIVSAKDAEIDRVSGLDGGADDYITKPFGVMEFISRVKAVLRRYDRHRPAQLEFEGIVMDSDRHIVTVCSEECSLTLKEYELLKYMILNSGIVLTREKLMDAVWSTEFAGESRTVDMHIRTLRQKLGARGDVIKTVRGVGYKLEK